MTSGISPARVTHFDVTYVRRRKNRMDAALRSDLAARGVAPECIETIDLVRDVLARVGDKWTVLVITALAPGPLRFTALHDQVAGVSQRMLSQTLRLLT